MTLRIQPGTRPLAKWPKMGCPQGHSRLQGLSSLGHMNERQKATLYKWEKCTGVTQSFIPSHVQTGKKKVSGIEPESYVRHTPPVKKILFHQDCYWNESVQSLLSVHERQLFWEHKGLLLIWRATNYKAGHALQLDMKRSIWCYDTLCQATVLNLFPSGCGERGGCLWA